MSLSPVSTSHRTFRDPNLGHPSITIASITIATNAPPHQHQKVHQDSLSHLGSAEEKPKHVPVDHVPVDPGVPAEQLDTSEAVSPPVTLNSKLGKVSAARAEVSAGEDLGIYISRSRTSAQTRPRVL